MALPSRHPRADFEAQWKDLLPLFSHVIVETTEAPWVHPEYICVISSIHLGLSNWYANKVAVNFVRGRSYKWEDACSRDNAFRCLPASEKTPPEGRNRRLAGLGVFRDYGFLDSRRSQVSSVLAELPYSEQLSSTCRSEAEAQRVSSITGPAM